MDGTFGQSNTDPFRHGIGTFASAANTGKLHGHKFVAVAGIAQALWGHGPFELLFGQEQHGSYAHAETIQMTGDF